jgi:methyl-accepting chemotaxis protein
MNARKYAVYGALFGCFFPLAGTLLQAGMLGGGGSMGARIGQVQAMPLMWIIDTAPFFLGLFASLAGRRQDEIVAIDVARCAAFAATAGELFSGAQALLATVFSFSSSATQTATSVRLTTATMQQLGHTAARAALTAETVVGMAEASRRCSEDGLRAMDLSNAEFVELSLDVRSVAALASGLEKRMGEIFEVSSLLGQLSEQSDRLSRGAAGQLARHPAVSGFGVVVEEMKRQAQDTQKAAVQVKALLGEMGKVVAATSTAARAGLVRAQHGAEVAGRTGQNIKKLAAALKESAQAAKEIALVAQQQDQGLDGMMKSMNEIYLATEETMASTQRVASEAQFLNDVAHRLDRSVRRAPADDALPAAALALPA